MRSPPAGAWKCRGGEQETGLPAAAALPSSSSSACHHPLLGRHRHGGSGATDSAPASRSGRSGEEGTLPSHLRPSRPGGGGGREGEAGALPQERYKCPSAARGRRWPEVNPVPAKLGVRGALRRFPPSRHPALREPGMVGPGNNGRWWAASSKVTDNILEFILGRMIWKSSSQKPSRYVSPFQGEESYVLPACLDAINKTPQRAYCTVPKEPYLREQGPAVPWLTIPRNCPNLILRKIKFSVFILRICLLQTVISAASSTCPQQQEPRVVVPNHTAKQLCCPRLQRE
ncbi:uncharacterized protein [Aphelocoma coerulescens]|uniref:uncharacterized protein n=1 Tax=Aphelocoma coerulescens TaxID=39617 RepID=UPI0036045B38